MWRGGVVGEGNGGEGEWRTGGGVRWGRGESFQLHLDCYRYFSRWLVAGGLTNLNQRSERKTKKYILEQNL